MYVPKTTDEINRTMREREEKWIEGQKSKPIEVRLVEALEKIAVHMAGVEEDMDQFLFHQEHPDY